MFHVKHLGARIKKNGHILFHMKHLWKMYNQEYFGLQKKICEMKDIFPENIFYKLLKI